MSYIRKWLSYDARSHIADIAGFQPRKKLAILVDRTILFRICMKNGQSDVILKPAIINSNLKYNSLEWVISNI